MSKKSNVNVGYIKQGGAGGFIFILVYVGALIYFIDKADGFWEVVLAFLQALVWPAFLIYNVFSMLQV